MPTFVYRAVTKNGTIVRNRVEDINRKSLIKKLKNNDLMPINIVQVSRIISKPKQKQKKNINNVNEIIGNAASVINDKDDVKKVSLLKRLGINLNAKITTRNRYDVWKK